jgi:hypothetical protein
MTHPSQPPRPDHSNYTWRRVQITKLLVMQFSPHFRHLMQQRQTPLPQSFRLSYLYPTFLMPFSLRFERCFCKLKYSVSTQNIDEIWNVESCAIFAQKGLYKLANTHPALFYCIIYQFETRLQYILHVESCSFKKKEWKQLLWILIYFFHIKYRRGMWNLLQELEYLRSVVFLKNGVHVLSM